MKLIKKLNLLDFLLFIAVFLSFTGFIIARAEKTGLNKIILDKENIAIEVLLPDVHSISDDYFMIGEKSAITIRNRPYTKLKVIKFEFKPKLIIIPNYKGSSYTIINDPTKAGVKDYFVTLEDVALKTSDGYVVGGNKIKVGNQIELEGFNYRFTGKITDVHPIMNIN